MILICNYLIHGRQIARWEFAESTFFSMKSVLIVPRHIFVLQLLCLRFTSIELEI
uniref:Uncharacterized protein n=1 Tax=Rhizophora mucronata TaxID=61149 RepID=A0A2P2P0H9_RHIMU